MNGRILLLNLVSTFLLLALVVTASAQTRTVGVSVGNKFRYSLTVSWSSNDPSATPPSYIVDANNTEWVELNVTAISGTLITTQGTTHLKNNTEITAVGTKDVNTGSGNMTMFLISANLTAGDSVYTSSSAIINETVPKWYSGVERDANHLDMTSSSGTQISGSDLYWDKMTGSLVEWLLETTNQTGTYTTTSSYAMQIISSNVWTVPEFPTWISALLILIAFTSATMVIARQRQLKDRSTKLCFFL
jgi:hypothetical protein